MDNSALLRRALWSNAGFSTLTGAAALLFPRPVAGSLEPIDPRFVSALGPSLLAFAATVAWIASRPRVNPRLALAVSVADIGWVLASIALVGLAPLSATGVALVLGVALVVELVATGQLLGIARLHRSDGSRGPHRSALIARRVIDAPAPEVWPMVADVGGYAEVAPNIAFSTVLSGNGETLVRRCGDHDGGTWEEHAALWDEGRAYAFDVQTRADGYPYPFQTLRGEWSVEPRGERSEVQMRFDFTLPGGILGELMAAVAMVPRFEPVVEAILDTWQQSAENRAG